MGKPRKFSVEVELPISIETWNPSENCQEIEDYEDTIQEGGEIDQNNEELQNDDIEAQIDSKDAVRNEVDDCKAKPIPQQFLGMNQIHYYSISVIIFIIVVISSIVIRDVSIVFGLIESVVSWFMVLVGPGSFYIITIHKKGIKFTGKWSVLTYILAWIYTIVGIIWMFAFEIWVIFQ